MSAILKSSGLPEIEKAMNCAESYEEWKALALEHDLISGKEIWKSKEESKAYDYKNIRIRLDTLRDLKAREDYSGLLFALNEGIHGNQGGMGHTALYEQAKFGAKRLIEEYVDEIVTVIQIIKDLPANIIQPEDKADFFHRASLCFGRSALMLSGAGSLGHFHGGVIKALVEHDLLPQVISGSSAGSVFAAVVGTHTHAELKTLIDSELLQDPLPGEIESSGIIEKIDAASLRLILEAVIPDLTFQEAYEKTGKKISVTIAPLEEHQTSRLMNAITSPNVFIRSAVQASCAVPGVYPPVMLMAKNVNGETQPYLPGRRWVDGAVTDDLPAKRLARLYAVNHYIVSQANPLALAMMTAERAMPMTKPFKNLMKSWNYEWLKSGERFSRRYLRAVPELGKAMSMFYSVAVQNYKGDVNIMPSFSYVNPRKLLAKLPPEEVAALVREGERATWRRLEQIRISTKIGRTLDAILDEYK